MTDAAAGGDAFERWVRSGLELIGLEASEVDLAVITAVQEIYRPDMDALMAADLAKVAAERDEDLSRAPR
jgi:hypothetical protein